MTCNLPIQLRDTAERAASVWAAMTPAERALARVEHERRERSLLLAQKRMAAVHRK